MFLLKANSQYKLAIVCLKSYCSKNWIVQSLSTCLLNLHFENIFVDPNLWTIYHILCLNEIKVKNVHLNSKIYHVLSQNFHVLSCYDEHGTMALHDDNVFLTENIIFTNSSVEFISTFFQW